MTQRSVESVAENAADTATADTATGSAHLPPPVSSASNGVPTETGARPVAEQAADTASGTPARPAWVDELNEPFAGGGQDGGGQDLETVAENAAATVTADTATGAAATPATPAAGPAKPKAAVADVEEAMRDVVDPELGINVVDLGLVYGVHVDDQNVITLDMTLTSAACPLTDVIEDQTRQALTTGPGGGLADEFRINWVWLPPWGPDKITDEGRDQLRALGFNV